MSLDFRELQSIELLNGLSEKELQRVAARLHPCDFLSGAVILTREQPADALYFLLAGKARVELRDNWGQSFNLTELGPGTFFGERAILTGEPRTADVRALTAVRAARLARTDFEALLHETPRLYANLCRELARRLGSWAQRHQREEQEHREVMADVIGWQLLPEFEAFPGNSSWVQELNTRLAALGATQSHVLIVGEPGTWKDLAARLIHFHGVVGRPVLFLDCAAPPPLPGEHSTVGSSSRDLLLLEMAQSAALFGYQPEPRTAGRRVRRGMLELADGGDLILRNIDLLTLPVQESLGPFLQSGRYRRQGETTWRSAAVRIIATSSVNLEERVVEGVFNPVLHERMRSETIAMLPLRERKKDIPVIARSLLRPLNAKHNKAVRRLSPEALNRLVDHNWPLNGSELYQVLSRAMVVCDSDTLLPEQIFLSGQPFGDGRFNLLNLAVVERLARRPDFPRLLRWSTIPLFLMVTLYTLIGPSRDNVANLAVWTLWWPALLATAFFFARSWCSFCPLEALGEFIGAKERVVRGPKPWLRRFGPSLSLSSLVAILFAEQASGMFSHPLTTGLLLLGLLLVTATADFTLGRRGWCKYLCPLGRVVSLFSRISLLEMRSNHTVCASRCRIDECIKEKGCPMGLHPTGIDNSDHCILCLNCVRNCPHHAMQLDLRNPAWGLFNRARYNFPVALFSVTLCGTLLAIKGMPRLTGRTPEIFPLALWNLNDLTLALVIVTAFVALTIIASLGTRATHWRTTFTLCGLAYLPLAFTGLFLYYFRALVEGGAQLVPLLFTTFGLGGWLDLPRLTPELGTLRLLIPPLIAGGTALAWFVLGRQQKKYALNRLGITSHKLMVLLTSACFLVLL